MDHVLNPEEPLFHLLPFRKTFEFSIFIITL